MQLQPFTANFIGRKKELDIFRRWLSSADQPGVLYFYDALPVPEKKGGVGKTWLLRKCAELARKEKPHTVVVMIDFFDIANRDSVAIAKHVVNEIKAVYPDIPFTNFTSVLQKYDDTIYTEGADDEHIEQKISNALIADFHELEQRLHRVDSYLLMLFDTFELVEQNPSVAILHSSRTFPDNYRFNRFRAVIAGRNALDWTHPNWRGREQEVLTIALSPFNQEEMRQYLDAESIYSNNTQIEQVAALYERTEGRPIMLSLATDVLNQRLITLQELVTIPLVDFESYLVAQINNLANPLNWTILFMAHVYHRFNLKLLERILHELGLPDPIYSSDNSALLKALSTLSFVRYPGFGKDFVLHDEMRRLVVKYCWEIQDIDQRLRRAISQSIIGYYEHQLLEERSKQEQQVATIELLYHKLYFDLDEGLAFFQEHIQKALRLWQLNFARLLLLEASKFGPTMSLAQQNTLLFNEAQLLRLEENPTSIKVIEHLEKNADPQWMEQNKADFLLEAGRCYHERSIFKEAREYFTSALDTVQNDEQTKAFILSYLGGVYRKQGQFTEAIRFFEQSTTILKALGDRSGYANTLSTIGSVMVQQGKYEEAMLRCKIALQIREEAFAHKEASELPIGYGLTTLGIIYLNTGNLLKAEKYFQRAFDIYTRVNYKAGIATTYNNFGHVELYRGNLEEARRWFIKGEQAAADINIEVYTNCLNRLGRICLERGQTQEALSCLQRAIESARQMPDYFQLGESLVDLAQVRKQTSQEDEAESLLQQAEEIAEREQYENLHAAIELIRAETALHEQHYHEGFRHLEQYCYHTLQHNVSGYSTAVRKIADVLLTVPTPEQSTIILQLIDRWTSRGLADRYPELIKVCKEVQEWSMG